MKRKPILAGAGALALLLAGGVIFYLDRGAHENKATVKLPRVVKLFRISATSKNSGISYPGRVRAIKHAALFFRVSGPVIERNLKYGQTVDQGAVLMRVDPRDYQREVDRLTQEVAMQKVQNELAGIEYERYSRLIQSKAVSQSVFDAARTKKLASAAQLDMLKVALKIAQDKLADTVLVAPFHGTVSDLMIEQYEIAKANVPVVLLDDLREVEIKISIPAGNLPDTNIYDGKQFLGQKFNVTFPGRGSRVFQAAIYEFKPLASESSESYGVTFRMAVPDDFLVLPGMSAEVHGLPAFQSAGEKPFILPFSAVVKRRERAFVWVYAPDTGTVHARNVSPGRTAGANEVYFNGNLKPGELVVATGGDWLTEGQPVRVLNPEVLHANH